MNIELNEEELDMVLSGLSLAAGTRKGGSNRHRWQILLAKLTDMRGKK